MTRAALGTLEVHEYLGKSPTAPLDVGLLPLDYPTAGPGNRYGAAVFIEKEGFDQQIAESGLADKHDVAFLSTKGMSVTASRELIDYLAGQGVRIFTVRDFDRVSTTEAARRLATTPHTIRRWVEEGRLRGQKAGKNLLVEEATVAAMERQRRNQRPGYISDWR